MRENNRNPIERCRKRLPQFTTMNVIDGQAGLVIYSSLIFYSLTIDNILNIIVLLILAGVSIAMLTGENGILTQATNARDKTDKATEEEKIQMAVLGSSIVDNGYAEVLDTDSLASELTNQFGADEFQLDANKGGSFLITINDTQRKYYVSIDKTVINSDNIVEISTPEELGSFRDDVNVGNTHEGKAVVLTNDIDLNGEAWTPIGYYPTTNSSPADETNKPFKGTFDGFGYEVDNFAINTTDKVQGLFGLVDNAKIANVGIGKNATIKGGIGTAGVVAYAYNGTRVYNCYNTARIEGAQSVGGIVGIVNASSVMNCYNSGSIIGSNICIGGVVGNCDTAGQILNCYNKGSVEGILPGGVAGQVVHEGIIRNCYNVGNITKIEGETYTPDNHYGVVGRLGIISEESVAEANNCYYLNGTVNGGNDIDECEGIENKTSEELKTLSNVLGDAFKEDKSGINNGYPILYWQ